LFAGPAIVRGQNLNSKIRLACIGVGGKGIQDVTRVECEIASRHHAATFPRTSRVRFDCPERDGLPPLKFWWYDGNPKSEIDPLRPPSHITREIVEWRRKLPESGCLIIGEKGKLCAPDDYGATAHLLLEGEKKFTPIEKHEACLVIPQSIPRSPGHYQEWVDAMNGGPPGYSNFEISAYLNEIILLGSLVQQFGEGRPMDWDGPNMKSTNMPEAARIVKRDYRAGWEPKV